MRINLGDEFDPLMVERVQWIKSNFKPDQYLIRDIGFIYPDFVVEFTEERYATLYLLHWN